MEIVFVVLHLLQVVIRSRKEAYFSSFLMEISRKNSLGLNDSASQKSIQLFSALTTILFIRNEIYMVRLNSTTFGWLLEGSWTAFGRLLEGSWTALKWLLDGSWKAFGRLQDGSLTTIGWLFDGQLTMALGQLWE